MKPSSHTDLSILTLLILCHIVVGAIYESFDDLPTRHFHYIIIGGPYYGHIEFLADV